MRAVVTALRESSESVSSSSWRSEGGGDGAIGTARLLARARTRARFVMSDFGCKKRGTGDERRKGSVRTPKLTTRDARAADGRTVPTAVPAVWKIDGKSTLSLAHTSSTILSFMNVH